MSNSYSNPFGDAGGKSSPFPPTGYPAPAYGVPQAGYYRPHRGGLVIALGIVGLVMVTVGSAIAAGACIPVPFFALAVSIPAWIFGHRDLQAMQNGELDPTGRGLTLAGMIMGIVSTAIAGIFSVIMLAIALFVFVFFIIAISAGNMR